MANKNNLLQTRNKLYFLVLNTNACFLFVYILKKTRYFKSKCIFAILLSKQV
ncbi:hypothetical protein A1OE_1151 [Candidatus Endolissoclinum faulkneri L2]|uniref:Uncharacterized protein n=1 Tax=Candidatus Endolissoclinum faulkneri L2 TaxID=1193729 RepID=K7YS06_9PROT|nr:hypothetical protein A1OE_1151 [Candidatus Endolissoclinum faulkneri L2]